ncbi:MAG: glycosyltransferase [Clostridium sp.]|nr:glycosyltransferase [Clostridium sp.]
MPEVSIIVPIYNAEKYMEKCIDSILNQTLNDIEVILVNDGSSDNSATIADNYAKNDLRVRVIHQRNSGPSVARNNGIKLATGKYIGFVDSDDYIENTMYERLFNIANDNQVQVAMCNYREIRTYDNRKEEVKSNLISNKFYSEKDISKDIISTFSKNQNYGFYTLCNKIYLREWLINSEIEIDTNRDHGEDWWFNINVFSKLESFICIEDCLYNYVHVNKESLMIKYRENQFDLFLDGRRKLVSIIPEGFIDYKELNTRFIYEFSSYIVRTFKEIEDIEKRRKLIKKVLINKEVIESCKVRSRLPFKYRIITSLIENKHYKTTYSVYKLISCLR